MRISLLVALALLGATPAWSAEEPSGCDKFKWPIDRERAALTAPDRAKLASGSEQAAVPSTGITLALVPPGDAKLPSPPERAPKEGTFAGFGKKYVSYYGCGSCHSIPGLEDESKIGTELTYEGSKLIERLDFGLHHERPEPEDPKSANQSEFAPLVTKSGGRTLGGHGFELPELFKRDFIKHKHDYDTKLVWFTGKIYSPRQYDKGKRRANWFERRSSSI